MHKLAKYFGVDDGKPLPGTAKISVPLSAPQTFVSKQTISQKEVKQTKTVENKSLSEAATLKKTVRVKGLTLEKLPDLPTKGNHKGLLTFARTDLDTLIDMAKSIKRSKEITVEDIDYVIDCFDYSGYFPFATRRSLAKQAVKVLSYMAQSKCRLTKAGITALVKELRLYDRKTLSNVVCALSYAVLNGQNLTTEESAALDDGLERLIRLNQQLYQPAIVIGLHAMTKQRKKLSAAHLEILRRSLAYIGKAQFNEFAIRTASKNGFHPKNRMSWFRTPNKELLFIKTLSQKSGLLAYKELLYAVHRANNGDLSKKAKTISILKNAIVNGQRDLPEMRNALLALVAAADEADRKIKQNAVLALQYLIDSEGKEIQQYEKTNSSEKSDKFENNYFVTALNNTLAEQRLHALNAVIQHLGTRGENQLPNGQAWHNLLATLHKDDQDAKIKDAAHLAILLLTNDLDNLSDCLLKEASSVEASGVFKNAARNKFGLSNKSISNLAQVVIGNYPIKAKHRSIKALFYIAENSQAIPHVTMESIIDYGLQSTDIYICSNTLVIIGYLAIIDIKTILSVKNIFVILLAALKEKDKSQNASFAIKNIIEHMQGTDCQNSVSEIILEACKILNDAAHDIETRKNVALVILHAMHKGFPPVTQILSALEQLFKEQNNHEIREKALEILNCIVSKNTINLSDEISKNLIEILKTGDENSKAYSASILRNYVKKSSRPFPPSLLSSLAELLKNAEVNQDVIEILVNIGEQKWKLGEDVFANVTLLLNGGVDYLRVHTAKLLQLTADQSTFTENLSEKIQLAFSDHNTEVVEHATAAFLTAMTRQHHPWVNVAIPQQTCVKLAEIASEFNHDTSLRVNAAQILMHEASRNKLCLEVLDILKNNLEESDNDLRMAVIDTLCRQTIFISKIINSNAVIKKIMETVEKLLLEENDTVLLQHFLKLLVAVAQVGYELSEPTWEFLADKLLNCENKTVRDYASSILIKTDATIMPPCAKSIRALEHASNVMVVTKQEDDRQQALLVLSQAAKNGQQLTYNNIQTLEYILHDKSYCINKDVLAICLAVAHNKQILPPGLINEISLAAVDNRYNDVALATLAQTIKNGQHISDDVLRLFEAKIISVAVVQEDILSAIEIATSRGKSLKPETTRKIVSLCKNEQQHLRHIAANIINHIIRNKQDCTDVIVEIVACLCQSEDDNVQIQLSSAVKTYVTLHKDKFNNDLLRQLAATLRKTINITAKANIMAIYDLLYADLPTDIRNTAAVKKLESQLCDVNITTAEKSVILNLITNTKDYWQKIDVSILAMILANNIVSPDLINSSLSLLNNLYIAGQQIPMSLLMSVIQHINSIATTDQAKVVLSSALKSGASLPADELINILLENSDSHIRSNVWQVVTCYAEWFNQLNPTLQRIIRLEELCLQYKTSGNKSTLIGKEIIKLLKSKTPLTFGSAETLPFLFDAADETTSVDLIAILCDHLKTNHKMKPVLLDKLLKRLVHKLADNNHNAPKIEFICTHILSAVDYNLQRLPKLHALLEQQILLQGITPQRIHIYKLLMEKTGCDASSQFIEACIAKILSNSEEKLSIQLIELLFTIVKRNSAQAKESINHIKKLIPLIVNYFPAMTDEVLNKRHPEKTKLLLDVQVPGEQASKKMRVICTPMIQAEMFVLLNYLYRFDHGVFSNLEQIDLVLKRRVSHKPNIGPWLISKIESLDICQRINILLTVIRREQNSNVLLKSLVASEPKQYCRTMLCTELLKQTSAIADDTYDAQVVCFYENLAHFERAKKYAVYSEERDNVLELLIEKQKAEKLSLQQINMLLVTLNYSSENPLVKLAKETAIIKQNWLKNYLLTLLPEQSINQTDIGLLISLLDKLQWDARLINLLFVNIGKLSNIDELVKFLTFIHKYEEARNYFPDYLVSFEAKANVSQFETWYAATKKHLLKTKLTTILDNCYFSPNSIEEIDDIVLFKKNFQDRLLKLIHRGWSFEKIYDRLCALEPLIHSGNCFHLYEAFDLAYCYPKITEEEFYSQDLLSSEGVSNLHHAAIAKCFNSDSSEKDLASLLGEIKDLQINKANNSITQLFADNKFVELYEKINLLAASDKSLPLLGYPDKPIKRWTNADIKQWALLQQNKEQTSEYLAEVLAVIRRACYLHCGYEPRTTQLLSIYTLLQHGADKGRLAQIATGEGKSAIIAILAVIQALQGKKVDIVTSSAVLAKRDADYYRSFYEMFNLKAASNEDDRYTTGLKRCYADDIHIVYGDASNFQFDILRHEYNLLNTRGNRGNECVIVDEVDNLLIDEGAKVAMLANTMPGMDQLEVLLIALWQQLERFHQQLFKTEDGQLYYQEVDQSNPPKTTIYQVDDFNQFAQTALEKYLLHITDPKNETAHIKIPAHLQEFVKVQTPDWVQSAIAARYH